MSTSTNDIETISEQRCFDGIQGFYSHQSEACGGLTMRFAVYQPPRAVAGEEVPVVTYLAGLTCNEETFPIKAGAQRMASALGLMLVAPDTSPRGADIAGEDDDWDFGTGAGFYLDATETPWSRHYNMYSYITRDLPAVIATHFPVDMTRQGIFGHSMGGHGALTIHLKNPDTYRSVSAFAPICAPTRVPWGLKAFRGYLGPDESTWRRYDACALIAERPSRARLLIDQGSADPFLDEQLRPELLVEACEAAGQPFELRMQPGYDHSYYFIQTFVEDHLRHHAEALAD
ncbi:MAG: S-formylglutathione hydrolase [Alphaproteobacteria bacterium]|nr:MAG: S-formylglutathione hydrolase [Alphaproteobacteria bacterium]